MTHGGGDISALTDERASPEIKFCILTFLSYLCFMRLKSFYKLLKENEEKIEIIDLITQHHPGYGTKWELSWYVGGMQDTGDWYYEKLLAADITTLERLLDDILSRSSVKQMTVKDLYEKWGDEKTIQVLDYLKSKGIDTSNFGRTDGG